MVCKPSAVDQLVGIDVIASAFREAANNKVLANTTTIRIFISRQLSRPALQ
jgi:hypothetical protein